MYGADAAVIAARCGAALVIARKDASARRRAAGPGGQLGRQPGQAGRRDHQRVLSVGCRPRWSSRATASSAIPALPRVPAGSTGRAALLLALGFAAAVRARLRRAGADVWATDEQGHGPIILAVALWLLCAPAAGTGRRCRGQPAIGCGWLLLVLGRAAVRARPLAGHLDVRDRLADPAAGWRCCCCSSGWRGAAAGLVPAVLPDVHGAAARRLVAAAHRSR